MSEKAKKPQEEPLDADGIRALAWIARGEPDSEIVFCDDAPRQTQEELALFRPASYRRVKR